MGNMVADSMREKYPGVDAAYTNSGGLRQDLFFTPPSAGEAPGEITWGEVFAVLPFGNRSTILTLTGDQLRAAFVNGFTPFCQPGFAGGTGRFPQISGLKVQFHCTAQVPVIDGMWKTPSGITGPAIPIGPADPVRIVTNDFMYGGGDGYTIFAHGTNVAAAGRRPAAGHDRLHHGALAGRPAGRGAHRRSARTLIERESRPSGAGSPPL